MPNRVHPQLEHFLEQLVALDSLEPGDSLKMAYEDLQGGLNGRLPLVASSFNRETRQDPLAPQCHASMPAWIPILERQRHDAFHPHL